MVLSWVTLKAEISLALAPLLDEKWYPEDNKAMHVNEYMKDLSYIHLHSSLSTGILRTHNVTSSQMA